ncbi:hypothetical protein SAY87_002592 [Trapa incisa]|uniref:Glycosyltransferase n=1 Tax=Trapa incisa TaxID=236973 RepID=A0AAN7PVM9_9MYRT|nr:hypothetical protein SAY87_002592 [Trapa incisa]
MDDRRETAAAINEKKAHVLVISYAIQGHINPLLQFSKRLASKGVKVTFIIPSTRTKFPPNAATSSIHIAYISDGYEEGENLLSLDELLTRFRLVVQSTLAKFIRNQLESPELQPPPTVLVYDSVMFWALDVALEQGLQGVPFFTQTCMVNAVYYLVHHAQIQIPATGPLDLIPELPALETSELPTLATEDGGAYPLLVSMSTNQFLKLEKAKWILINTFSELEAHVLKWMMSKMQSPILPVGPTIPSIYLDQRLENDKEYGLQLFVPEMDACMKWLDSREVDSVIYVSFGSLASLGEEQMEEIAWGLKSSNIPFLWVVRESEKKKLPAKFLDEIAQSDIGLVVGWCSQLEVLVHKAVGCFMTHCGWNSTLEALCLGVPLIAIAQWTDQTTNAKFIEDVWKVGIRVPVDGKKRMPNRNDIMTSIRELMEGERGKDIRKNSARWREMAKQAVSEGGSSDRNIDHFVAQLVR